MEKKWVILVTVSVAVIVFAAGLFIMSREKSEERIVSPVSQGSQTSPKQSPTPPEGSLTSWQDPAGFSFSYPEGLSLDVHPEDNQNYSHLTFTAKNQPGEIFILVSETSLKTAAQWQKQDKEAKTGQVLDTTLGGTEAKKVLISDTEPKLITAVVDQGALFVLALRGESAVLSKAYEKILATFAFEELPSESGGGAPAGGGDVVEEEAVE